MTTNKTKNPTPSPKPSAEGTPGWRTEMLGDDAPSGETLGTCDLQRNPVSLFKLHWTDHAEVDACVNWKPLAPEAVGTKEPILCAYCEHPEKRHRRESCGIEDCNCDGFKAYKTGSPNAPGEAVGRLDKSPIPERYETDVADFKRRELRAMAKYASEAVGRETRELTNDQQLTLSEADGPLYYIFEADCSFSVADPQPIHPLYVSTLRRERDQLKDQSVYSQVVIRQLNEDVAEFRRDCTRFASQVRELTAQVKAHRESDQDRDRLVRELDHALFGPTTARQARLCDLAKTVPGLVAELRATIERLKAALIDSDSDS